MPARRELARFQREIEAVATLRHPTSWQIYEVGDHAGRPYYTMELVDGGTLAQQLLRRLRCCEASRELIATLAVTVPSAHKSGFIRDLKPANILLTAPLTEGGPRDAEDRGLGLARFVHAEPELTFTGARLGTPNYMAPEQALGKTADIGPAADIYAARCDSVRIAGRRHPPFDWRREWKSNGVLSRKNQRRPAHQVECPPRPETIASSACTRTPHAVTPARGIWPTIFTATSTENRCWRVPRPASSSVP